eukprot:154488-Chlamydomonas_euryale.AAC.1
MLHGSIHLAQGWGRLAGSCMQALDLTIAVMSIIMFIIMFCLLPARTGPLSHAWTAPLPRLDGLSAAHGRPLPRAWA